MDSFYVALPSNTIYEGNFTNKTSNFCTKIPNTLSLDFYFEVGVVEVNIPYTWCNIVRDQTELTFSKSNEIPGEPSLRKLVNIKAGHYPSAKELLQQIRHVTPDWFEGNIKFDKTSQTCSVNLPNKHQLVINNDLAQMLGFDRGYFMNFNPNGSDKKVKATNMTDLSARSRLVYIYTNVVKDILVGSQYSPILKIISVAGTFGDMIYKDFQNPLYLPTKLDHIPYIEISLRHDNGNLVQFEYGKSLLILHFRKKQNG
jgi:hypothetical protein